MQSPGDMVPLSFVPVKFIARTRCSVVAGVQAKSNLRTGLGIEKDAGVHAHIFSRTLAPLERPFFLFELTCVRQVRAACVPCARSKKACDEARPCSRCVQVSLCSDEPCQSYGLNPEFMYRKGLNTNVSTTNTRNRKGDGRRGQPLTRQDICLERTHSSVALLSPRSVPLVMFRPFLPANRLCPQCVSWPQVAFEAVSGCRCSDTPDAWPSARLAEASGTGILAAYRCLLEATPSYVH